jgi:hypothetical protein
MMFHFIKRNGDHRRHNTVSLVVWICRTLFFFFFPYVSLRYCICLLFSLLSCFSPPLALLRGLMMNESMPYTQKEGVVFGEDDGWGVKEDEEAKEGNKNGTWGLFFLSLSCNEQLSLSLSRSFPLCLSLFLKTTNVSVMQSLIYTKKVLLFPLYELRIQAPCSAWF